MRIGIIGIGGVGGYFGGKLAGAYASTGQHEIIFFARGQHLKSIQESGLQLRAQEGNYVVWPNIATDDATRAGILDLVFVCVKSYSLESSALSLKKDIDKNTVVIPLLNGINSAERLRAILPEAAIVSGSVYIISHLEKPGVVHQEGGACRLVFGTDDPESALTYSNILNILKRAKIDAILTDKISEALWTKYLLMCPLASLTSATGKTYGAILDDPELRERARNMMQEVAQVARARHILLSEDIVDRTMAMIARFGYDSKTSMQLDRERGSQTEIDALTGFLCRAGRESEIPTPLHDEVLRQLAG